MNNSRDSKLQHLTALNEQMLSVSQVHDWDRLSELENQRCALLDQFFAVPPGLEEVEAVKKMILRASEIHKKILTVVEANKTAMRAELTQMNKGRKALAAYATRM